MYKKLKFKSSNWQAVIYFALAYAWSWAWWIPATINFFSQETDLSRIPNWIVPYILIGGYGPSIVSIVVTALSNGRKGVRQLLSKLTIWKAPVRVHALVWIGQPVFLIIAMLLYANTVGSLGDLDWSQLQLIPSILLISLIFGPMAEELGWRGYALPLLQKKHSSFTSSLIMGIVWCFWHAPLFWMPAGTLISGQEITFFTIGIYLLFTCGFAFLFTWIINKSNGSVLLSIVFHVTINAPIPLLLFPNLSSSSSLTIKYLSLVIVWTTAIVIIFTDKQSWFSQHTQSNEGDELGE